MAVHVALHSAAHYAACSVAFGSEVLLLLPPCDHQ